MASKTLARGMGTFFKDCEHPESRWSKCPHPYKIRYRNAAGKQTEESGFANQTLAIERLTEIYNLKKSTPGAKLKRIETYGSMRFQDYAEAWISRRRNIIDGTVDDILKVLKHQVYPIVGARRMDAFDSFTVEGFISTMERNDVPAPSQHKAFIRLRSVLLDAHTSGIIPENPFTNVDPPSYAPKKAVIPTFGQLSDIRTSVNDRFCLTADLMSGCGMRNGEALAVNINNIVADDVYRITEQVHYSNTRIAPLKHRKEGEFREAPLPTKTRDSIFRYADKYGVNKDGYLLRAHNNPDSLMPARSLERLWEQCKKKVTVPDGMVLYGLRHYFASNCLTNGIPITDVAEWMGHKSIEITFQTYRHLMPGSIGRAVKILDMGLVN
ncbi:tyrosine-type recombinase/integrase [Streptomyces yunnanensis]|uniref:Site-specific recombinase XerD n=1 Tax=Streptomyces yunnanensis TaxID=156453 RepID=A0A9X8N0D8_9ACTN|nr:tyrosine-type recombinase/integrase [Streptomyces yunnanensis]SHM51584.1 Site-specific recombinase XerD [Streptomyces yunnanensis]